MPEKVSIKELAKKVKVGDIIAEVWCGETIHYMICQKITPIKEDFNFEEEKYEIKKNAYTLVNLTQALTTSFESNSIEGLLEDLASGICGIYSENIYLTKMSSVTVEVPEYRLKG